jgi:hypothetical protein
VFSPDSRHLAYTAQTFDKKSVLVLDGTPGPAWDAIGFGEPVFSVDSSRLAVMVFGEEGGFLRKRKLYTVAVDGRLFPQEQADEVAMLPEFSPDGARVAWWLQRGSDAFLVVDGVVQAGAPVVESDVRFDAAGRIVYVGRIGASQTVIVDGRPGPAADAIARLAPTRELFRHDTLQKSPAQFRLSADGAHVAWAGAFGGRACPVFDDEVGPDFDQILECVFDGQDGVVWWAQRGTEIVRVTRAF